MSVCLSSFTYCLALFRCYVHFLTKSFDTVDFRRLCDKGSSCDVTRWLSLYCRIADSLRKAILHRPKVDHVTSSRARCSSYFAFIAIHRHLMGKTKLYRYGAGQQCPVSSSKITYLICKTLPGVSALFPRFDVQSCPVATKMQFHVYDYTQVRFFFAVCR